MVRFHLVVLQDLKGFKLNNLVVENNKIMLEFKPRIKKVLMVLFNKLLENGLLLLCYN